MEFWVAIEATNLYDIVKWALVHYGIIIQWRFLTMLANVLPSLLLRVFSQFCGISRQELMSYRKQSKRYTN